MLIRPITPSDHTFILGLANRFTDFPLPPGRPRQVVEAGILRDLARHVEERPANSFFFILEEDDGTRAGFIHLLVMEDFFSGGRNCHVSDLAVAQGHEGRGHARRLLVFAEEFGREQRCERLTLAVFPGNERARKLYETAGWNYELLRMSRPL